MNVALRQVMTLEQFLVWEDRQELRYEFDGFQPVATTGGTLAHAAIQASLMRTLGNRLDGGPCRPFGSHLKILVAGHIRYPDAFILCTRGAPGDKVATAPVVVFEILSPRTASIDLVVKNAEYRATPSIQRYVVLSQTRLEATVFFRQGEDWLSEILVGPDAVVGLPEVSIEIPLTEIYANVDLEPEDDEA